MEAYLLDWLSLLARWAHLAVGIAWIGASFYFVWLDNHLEPSANPTLYGDLWALQGRGLYHAEKFKSAPPEMPLRLHWFKWDAYWTWITGFFLLVLVYYAGADLYLIDPSVLPLSRGAAIGIGIGSLVGALVVYEALCRSLLGKNDVPLGMAIFALLAATAWGLCQVFGGRGAFIHYGAILGTIMVGNVAHVIVPAQRRMLAALGAGRLPDPQDDAASAQRAAHNTYLALPVLVTMISSHYAFSFGTRWNWLVLVVLTLAGGMIRMWFVMRHKGRAPAWPVATALGLLVALGFVMAPEAAKSPQSEVRFQAIKSIIDARCAGCHAAEPHYPGIAEAPKGVMLDTAERIRGLAAQLRQQTVLSRAMPPGNLTRMTDEERALLERWILSGAKID